MGALVAGVMHAELMLCAVSAEPLVVLPETRNGLSVEAQTAAVLREIRDAFAPNARIAIEPDPFVPRALQRMVRRGRADVLVVGSSAGAHRGRVRLGRHIRQLLVDLRCALAIAPRGIHEG